VVLRGEMGSEEAQGRVVEAAEGVVVDDGADDAAVLGQDTGLGLYLLGGEDAADGRQEGSRLSSSR